MMSYCDSRPWISAFHYDRLLQSNFEPQRLSVERSQGAPEEFAVISGSVRRDVFATIDQAPVGADITIEVRVDGALLTTLTILAGQTVSTQAVLGGDLGPIAAGVEIWCDLTTVGTTFPRAGLAVVLWT